ncbi:MAG TPA: hypothetical protein PK280_09230 [Planctomycetota bacterium]|nr:hypothetical protein [Planctomycetota bacterium]
MPATADQREARRQRGRVLKMAAGTARAAPAAKSPAPAASVTMRASRISPP